MWSINAFGFNTIQTASFSHRCLQWRLILFVRQLLRLTTLTTISYLHSKYGWTWHIKTLLFMAPLSLFCQRLQNMWSCLTNGLECPQITSQHVPQPITAFQCSILFNSCWPRSACAISRCCHCPRLVIPVFQEFIFEAQKQKKQDSWGFLFFPVFSGGIFHRYLVLEGVAGITVFCQYHRNFCRNSCGTGIPVFTPDSSGFLRIPPDSSRFLRIPVPAKSMVRLMKAFC